MARVRFSGLLGSCAVVGFLTWCLVRGSLVGHLEKVPRTSETRARAEKGDAVAQAELASAYFHGWEVEQDDAQALVWYRKSADQGAPQGECGLAWMYSHGLGVSQDYSQAIHWYKLGADQGSAPCQNGLAYFYVSGRGVQQDHGEALRLYRLAANQGYAKAEYNLGNMYFLGEGVARDRAQARIWIGKAADQGDDYARAAVGQKLTRWRSFLLMIQIIGGLTLASGPFSLNIWEPRNGIRDLRDWTLAGTGFLCLISAAVSWYGYRNSLIWCWVYGVTGFTLLKWSLNALVIVLLIHIARNQSNPRALSLRH